MIGKGRGFGTRTSCEYSGDMEQGRKCCNTWVLHNRVCGIHKLVESEFVKESVGLLSVSIKNGWFFSLKGFIAPYHRVQVLLELWWQSWRWCWRRWSLKWFLRWFRVWCRRPKLVSCQEGPRKRVTCRGYRFGRCCGLRRCWRCNSSDFGSGLVVRPLYVIVDVRDLFQSSFNVIDWASFSW